MKNRPDNLPTFETETAPKEIEDKPMTNRILMILYHSSYQKNRELYLTKAGLYVFVNLTNL